MTVEFGGFVLAVGGLALVIVGLFYLFGRKSQGLKNLGFLLGIGVVGVSRWVFPNVYTIDECGKVTAEFLILPTSTHYGNTMTYGSHCYLINNTDTELWIETALYGNKTAENSADEIITETVPPKSDQKFDVISLDYFFEDPRSIRTRSRNVKEDGIVQYTVRCAE